MLFVIQFNVIQLQFILFNFIQLQFIQFNFMQLLFILFNFIQLLFILFNFIQLLSILLIRYRALVQKYLLEKSRICFQAKNERNYHVFYHLLVGSSAQEKQTLYLLPPHAYRYLNQVNHLTFNRFIHPFSTGMD